MSEQYAILRFADISAAELAGLLAFVTRVDR
jgi:hypothetical protein